MIQNNGHEIKRNFTSELKNTLYYLFWVGCLIGSTWEFTFPILGDQFAHAVKIWPWGLSGWPKKMSHSIWDGGILMFGI